MPCGETAPMPRPAVVAKRGKERSRGVTLRLRCSAKISRRRAIKPADYNSNTYLDWKIPVSGVKLRARWVRPFFSAVLAIAALRLAAEHPVDTQCIRGDHRQNDDSAVKQKPQRCV